MTKRKELAQKTKLKLVKTALELFKDTGFYDINVEDITAKAGVSKGTFYTYFKRKEDVVLEISRAPFSEIADELEKMTTSSLIEKLSYYCKRFMECVEFSGIHICRQWTRDVIDPNNVPENKDNQKWVYDFEMLKKILEHSVNSGELKSDTPIELLTHIIICQLYGMMTCWCMSDGKFEPLEWVDNFSKIQLENILKPHLN